MKPEQRTVEEIYASPQARGHALHLGMWLFLGSETLLFAGLFALYSAYRTWFPAEFTAGIQHNNAVIGTLNTAVLIISSFFVAWSIHAIRGDRRRTAMLALGGAIVLGATFLVLKATEYGQHFAEGLAPGKAYSSTELPQPGVHMFFNLYYAMTALHALHVIAGMAILSWLTFRIWRRRTNPERHVELELGGLYWHLVDVVWIFLWPLLYLMD